MCCGNVNMSSSGYSYRIFLSLLLCLFIAEVFALEASHFFYQQLEYPRDCKEVYAHCSSDNSSGVHTIKPDGYLKPFQVYCDYQISSGGWTVIQRQVDGSLSFKRNWEDYQNGFGFLSREFYIGNDKLSFLTNQAAYELRIDMTLSNGSYFYVKYNSFRISDEWSQYALVKAEEFSGNSSCVATSCPIEMFHESCTCQTSCSDPEQMTDCRDVCVETCVPKKCFVADTNAFILVIQRRVNGSTDFYRNWTSYKNGFGNIREEFWLGNEKLFYLTQQATYEYRVDFVSSSDVLRSHKFSMFRVHNETNKYMVTDVGSHRGYGISLRNTLNTAFSTYDQDNDGQSSINCAEGHHSGWWHGGHYYYYYYSYCDYFPDGSYYRYCSYAILNGDYNGGNGKNIFASYTYCFIKYTEMKIRRTS